MIAAIEDNADIDQIAVDHCLLSKCFVRKLAQTYPPVTIRVYPYPCSRVRVYVGSAVPYPDPYPPNPYPRTRGVSKTLAQH